MLEQLKAMAMQRMASKMMSNALGASETNEAAEAGSNALMDIVKSQIAGGGMSQITDLFTSGGASMENNGIFQEVQSKMMGILQNKGMSAEDAQSEAASTTTDLISGLREKFESKEEADSAFDLNNIAGMLGGNAGGVGGMLNKVKDLF